MDRWKKQKFTLFLCRHHPLNNLFVTLLVEIQFVANLVTSFPPKTVKIENKKHKIVWNTKR